MFMITSDLSTPEAIIDSQKTNEVDEAVDNYEINESEMDKDLAQELDNSYDAYMKLDNSKSYKHGIDVSKSEKRKFNETNEPPPDSLNLDFVRKNNLHINNENSDNIESNRIDFATNYRYTGYNKQVEYTLDNAETSSKQIKCRNEILEGQKHPETGVLFERKLVEVDGEQFDVVVPKFESIYDAQLPKPMFEATDREQFRECNVQLKNELETNKDLRDRFDDEQLEQIENEDTPDGYTWHHDAEAGKMQLVDTETHQKTGHTGGRSIWGGGTENR